VFDRTGRSALVTGAGQGVGAGIARALAAQGAAVAVNDVRPERAQQVVDELVAAGARAVVAPFDVTVYASVRDGIAAAVAAIGPIDVLVNNAGNGGQHGMIPAQFRGSNPETWHGPVDVNLYGVMNCCHVVLDAMCDKGFGRIITIASGAGMVGLRIGVSPYAAGKGGAIAFMRHLAVENARRGVTANTIALGLMTGNEGSEVTKALAQQVPVGRLGRPDDIGPFCVYAASDEAAWFTGQTVHVNGGSVTS
jgi:NAD(P)-dependent dehydrogenase (short-subunit alcohol dehydrogenase family)